MSLGITCTCGGKLKKSHTEVEFYGINFGIMECEICEKCGEEYLDQKVMENIEQEVKKRRIFGFERDVQVTKSGNSLVIRIPPEIAKFVNLKYKTPIRIYPTDKKRLELEIIK